MLHPDRGTRTPPPSRAPAVPCSQPRALPPHTPVGHTLECPSLALALGNNPPGRATSRATEGSSLSPPQRHHPTPIRVPSLLPAVTQWPIVLTPQLLTEFMRWGIPDLKRLRPSPEGRGERWKALGARSHPPLPQGAPQPEEGPFTPQKPQTHIISIPNYFNGLRAPFAREGFLAKRSIQGIISPRCEATFPWLSHPARARFFIFILFALISPARCGRRPAVGSPLNPGLALSVPCIWQV